MAYCFPWLTPEEVKPPYRVQSGDAVCLDSNKPFSTKLKLVHSAGNVYIFRPQFGDFAFYLSPVVTRFADAWSMLDTAGLFDQFQVDICRTTFLEEVVQAWVSNGHGVYTPTYISRFGGLIRKHAVQECPIQVITTQDKSISLRREVELQNI